MNRNLRFFFLLAIVALLLGCQYNSKKNTKKINKTTNIVAEKPVREADGLFGDIKPVVLEQPPVKYYGPKSGPKISLIKLVQQTVTPNKVSDSEQWLEKNKLTIPGYSLHQLVNKENIYSKGKLPARIKKMARHINAAVVQAISHPSSAFLSLGVYEDTSEHSYQYFRGFEKYYIVGLDPLLNKVLYTLDFDRYKSTGKNPTSSIESKEHVPTWMIEENGVLYVSHSREISAKDSGGVNAYLTAINLTNYKILWRSQPLVSNAHNFLLLGDTIVASYGFANEPDYLYLINKYTGKTIDEFKLKSAADRLIQKDNLLYVHSYDQDYIFEIKQ